MGEQWAVALGQKKTELFLNEGWSSPDQVKCAGKWGGWLPSPGSASSPRPLSSCSYTSSLPAPQHIQPWLLLISNTPISKNQVPGALPKPRALKKSARNFLPVLAPPPPPGTTLAAEGLMQSSSGARELFLSAFLRGSFQDAMVCCGKAPSHRLETGLLGSINSKTMRQRRREVCIWPPRIGKGFSWAYGWACFQHGEFFLHLKDLFVLRL